MTKRNHPARSVAAFSVLGLLLFSGFGGAQTAEPKFIVGDVSTLSCRVVKVKRIEPRQSKKKVFYGSIVTVEVRNRGRLTAEPTTFQINAKKDVHGTAVDRELRRFDGSGFGRAGRAIRPGSLLTYELLCSQTLKGKSGVTVKVVAASFFKGVGVDTLTIKAKRKGEEKFKRGTMTFTAPIFTLSNPLAHPVDVAFSAKIRRPFKGRAIVRRRLEANEKARWKIEGYYFHGSWGMEGVDIQSLKLIDWSVIRDDGVRTANEAFKRAYDRWARWSKPVTLSGRFRCRTTSRQEINGKVTRSDVETRGRFQLTKAGEFQLQPDKGEGVDPNRLRSLGWNFERAFADIKRPTIEKVFKENKLYVITIGQDTLLSINGPTWSRYSRTDKTLKITDDTLVASGHSASRLTKWTVQPRGDSYVVTARNGAINDVKDGLIERYAYDFVGEHLVPLKFYSRTSFVKNSFRTIDLELTEVHPTSGPQLEAPAPQGPGVAGLRAAWNGSYRYPAQNVTFSGRYVAENKGRTEALWEGLSGAKGTFKFVGYRGRGYGHHGATVSDKLAKPQAQRIGELVLDRFRIWFGRDFNGREPFERAFAGATIEIVKPGVFRTSVARFRKLIVRDGRIHSIIDASGWKRTFRYTKIGDHHVLTKVIIGDAVYTAKYKVVGDWIVPVDMVFERVFGKDWGPERVIVKEPRITVDG